MSDTAVAHEDAREEIEDEDAFDVIEKQREAARKGLGISVRLPAAFAISALLTLIVSAVAWFSLGLLGDRTNDITAESVPALTEAAALSEQANRLAAAAPALANASNEEERAAARAEIDQILDSLFQGVDTVSAPDIRNEITAHATALKTLVETMDTSVHTRFELNQTMDAYIERVAEFEQQAKVLLPIIVRTANFAAVEATSDFESAVKNAGSVEDAASAAGTGSAKVLGSLQPLRKALSFEASFSQEMSILRQAATANTIEQVDALDTTFFQINAKLPSAAFSLPEIEERDKLNALLAEITDFYNQDNNIFAVARQRIELAKENATVVEQMRQAVAEMERLTSTVTTGAKTELDESIASILTLAETVKLTAIGMGVVALLVALAIGIFYVRNSLVKRLKNLAAIMTELADGNLDVRIPRGGRDEITLMALTLVTFRENAKRVREAEQAQEEERAMAAAERKRAMKNLADRFEASVSQIVKDVGEASARVRTAAQQLVDVSGEAERQSDSTSEISSRVQSNMQSVSAATEEMTASVAEIGRQIQTAVEITSQAVSAIEKTESEMGSLASAAEEIGGVLEVISDIADQTNLLALNATIEAARAGEAGKGFAVVANEVKSLARQTVSATEQITGRIAAMQSTTTTAVDATQDIGRIVRQIDEISGTIAEAARQQEDATAEIAHNIAQSTADSEAAAGNMESVAQAARTTGSEANTLLGDADTMASLSGKLDKEVGGFLDTVRRG